MQAAWEAALETGTSVVDIFNLTRNEELWRDTSDGTHVGWKANLVKVDRVLRVSDRACENFVALGLGRNGTARNGTARASVCVCDLLLH